MRSHRQRGRKQSDNLFDRPTRVTYPDGAYDETSYQRLDVATRRDRLGRLTRYSYDGARQLTSTRDPAGRVVTQEWCACGSLEALVDANGNRTRWERDVQGRVTREVRTDGVTATVYTYQAKSGRLATVTDPKQQVTTYSYARDDQRLSMTFVNAAIPTPGVSFTYDAVYSRLATMTDGTGVTTYSYHVPGLRGAGQVATVDGPLVSDTITYTYDDLGRVESRGINGSANTVTWAFDALGRVETENNVLGTFTYTYDGATPRVASVIYPNGQRTLYNYFGTAGDHRLQTIHHQYPNQATLSKFDYTYDKAANILTWRQQVDATAVQWEYGYDSADQLVAAVKKSTDPTPAILQRYAYGYDPAGNRTSEQIDDQLTGTSYDNLNRLVSQQAAGAMQFAGTVSEPSTVTIQTTPAAVTAANAFSASVPVAAGTNTVTVAATDVSGNTASHVYEVTTRGSSKSFTYDANGNLISDGTRAFEWDARNQLASITVGTLRTAFKYDGLQRRVGITETDDGVVNENVTVLWCDNALCERRAENGSTVMSRMFPHGEQRGPESRYMTTDQLFDTRDVTDGQGGILARYSYDPWGRRNLDVGDDVTTTGYTGHEWQEPGELWLTLYRAYDPDLGRWISNDPIGAAGGVNLYGYVLNNPIDNIDPYGLKIECRSTIERRDVTTPLSSCGAGHIGGCTTPNVSAFTEGSCRRRCPDGSFGFNGFVQLSLLVEFNVPRTMNSKSTPGSSIDQHENLHVGDMRRWCSSLNSTIQSEGFKTFGECETARKAFVRNVNSSRDDARRRSGRMRDK